MSFQGEEVDNEAELQALAQFALPEQQGKGKKK